jgi:hypothetical protein
MIQIRNRLGWIILLILLNGCDDGATHVAREAANRQAQQNTFMADLHKEVASGNRQLVAADAEARKEILTVHHDLQAERGRLDTGWNALEHERQQISRERRVDSMLAPILSLVGGFVLVSTLLGFSWYALAATNASTDVVRLNEVLLTDVLLADPPFLIDSASQNALPQSGCSD